MLQRLTIKDMVLNSDIPSWELPPNAVTHGKNFRVGAGALSTSGGSTIMATSPAAFNPGSVLVVVSPSGVYWLAMGRNSVRAFDGANWGDVTSAAGYAGIGTDQELLWTGCTLGQIPIINNPQHVPEYWSPQSTGQVMQPLKFDAATTWAAKGYHCKIMRSHKNFLFAMNLQEGATENHDAYRWSHPADVDGLPFTWDETDTSGIAGKAQIGGDKGAIIDGLSLRDSFCIYSQNGISILDYTGGEFVWKQRELSSTMGLFAKDCVVEVKGSHFFLADGDIVVNDGSNIDSIIHDVLRRRLSARANAAYYDRSFVARNDTRKEIWFCVPEDEAIYPNTAYIYNWRDNTWAIRDLPDNLTYASFGPTQIA